MKRPGRSSKTSGKKLRTTARAPLTRHAIVAEAIALAGEEGLGALTMRTLAARLRVEAMALYHHFPSKDALLDGITESLEAKARPQDVDGTWQDRLRAIAERQIDVAIAHPQLVSLTTSRRGGTEAVFANNEDVLCALKDAGLGPASRAIWLRAFASFINGLAHYMIALKSGPTKAPLPDAARYPLVVEAAHYGKGLDQGIVLKTGLDSFFAAIERQRR